MVWEFRPGPGWNKGSAVTHSMAHFNVLPEAAFFLGDDETDDDVFNILGPSGTFIVGERQSPTAAWRCRDPEDVAELLTWIADFRGRAS